MSSSATTSTPEPVFVQPKPYKVDLEPGKEYYWCSCGQSKNQPFCDGTHRGGPFKPKKIVVDEAKTYYLCGCKYSHDKDGFCDGTHRKEEGIKKYNEFLLKANSKLKEEHQQLKDQIESSDRKQKIIITALSAVVLAVMYTAKYTTVFSSNQ
ncbi:iron-binding zinc finger CDGSH type-domain-containing protein [Zychaea mexicana]|uniref:iron-binding zinc finger CDGSH type-domain-containing protein n=1 Tax=Zychaea mexicana TaxID=64656 RepID=UPI0022FEBF3A|nr:iron-binding zinc finger CDGSH type-domain-containing protein [Zychaea mexicana]KAI9491363.1 iron-binding zinc finger CDGSH type-domain-containing protein [Zychaea mexicana]